MKRLLTLVSLVALVGTALAAGPPTPEQLAGAKYFGARGCKACHMSRAQGRMYKIWEAGSHASAYDTLGTPRGRAVAAEHGVEDPQNDERCLKCHATAFGVPDARRNRRFTETEGVSCESCHGAGQYYRKRQVMCQLVAGTLTRESVGLTIPAEATCVGCHNDESPTWSGSFNFEEMLAKIAHPIPEARKQKIATEGCGATGR